MKASEIIEKVCQRISGKINELSESKVDKNQGKDKKGKALIVGEDGIVTTGEAGVSVDETLTQNGKAADAKAAGDKFSLLSESITEISDDVLGAEYSITLARKNDVVITENGTWFKTAEADNTESCFIPVRGGEKLTIEVNDVVKLCHIAFLKDNDISDAPNFCNGYTSRIVFNSTYESTIPSDCRYIYVMTKNTNRDFTPKSFVIDGYDITDKISSNLLRKINPIGEELERFEQDYYSNNKRYVSADYIVEKNYYWEKIGKKTAISGFDAITIDLKNLDGIKIYGYQATSMLGIAFRDSTGAFVADRDGEMFHIPKSGGYNTIELQKPVGAVDAVTSFSVSSGRTYEITGITCKPNPSNVIDMPSLADVIMIPIFGQSLSVGAASTPVISKGTKYGVGTMFNGGVNLKEKAVSYFTDFIPLDESVSNVETVSTGCVEKIMEQIQKENGLSVHSEYWKDKKILFVSCGTGSKTVSQLIENYLVGLKNAIQGAKNICDRDGLTLNVPCWIWIQGETDQKEGEGTSKPETTATDLETYKSRLLYLHSQLNTHCKSVTGQTNNIKCVCYQSASQNIVALDKQPKYGNYNVMGVPTAQMQLVRDNADFVGSAPVYILTHSTVEPIHLSAEGEKMLGLYCGIASKAVIFGEKAPTGLCPKTYSISGNTLKIVYDVPVPPMRFDSTWVKEVTNKGFVLLDSNNANIINTVSVFDDTVTIECKATPLNARLFYGFNGQANRDGRFDGSRGNLCDSAQYVFDGEIDGKRYALSNYAYAFVKKLDAENGTI